MFIKEKIHNLYWKINLSSFEGKDKGWMCKHIINQIEKWPLEIAQRIYFLISGSNNADFYNGKSKFTNEYNYFITANKINWKINDNLILPLSDEGCKFAQD